MGLGMARNEGETMWHLMNIYLFMCTRRRRYLLGRYEVRVYMWYELNWMRGCDESMYLIMQIIWQRLKKRKYRKTYLMAGARARSRDLRWCACSATHIPVSSYYRNSQKTLTDSLMVHLIADISLTIMWYHSIGLEIIRHSLIGIYIYWLNATSIYSNGWECVHILCRGFNVLRKCQADR